MNPNRSDRRSGPGLPARADGFVLVAVLVALVVITLLATAVATVSQRAVAEARANVEAFETEIASVSTRDTVLFLLTTQRQTYAGLTVDEQVAWTAGQATAGRPEELEPGGLPPRLPVGNEIRFDDTPYRGVGEIRFALQDDAGRFSPNWTFPLYRPGFFHLLEVPPEQRPALEAKRLDYQDPDHLVRLGGAEAPDYLEQELPPPVNRTLMTPLELRRIPGWREALAGYDDAAVMSMLTATRSVMINVNTAPVPVLQSLPGVDEAKAGRIAALRERMPFMLPWEFLDEFDIPLDDMAPVGMLAIPNGTLKLWHNEVGPIRVIHWTLTPTDEGGRPWRLDYEITLPRDDLSDDSLARATASPLFAEPDPAGG